MVDCPEAREEVEGDFGEKREINAKKFSSRCTNCTIQREARLWVIYKCICRCVTMYRSVATSIRYIA